MPSEAEIFAAEIAAALCAERLRAPGALGAFAERLPPLHRPTFIECLSAAANRPTRVAVLGGGPWEGPAFNGIEITTDPTRANQWRNDAEATSGRACVVLVVGQVAKVNSLRSSVPLVHAEDVRRAAAQRAIAMLDTPERRAFWNTITDDAAVSNNALLEFAAQAVAAARCGQAMLLEREPQLLHHLGLLPDASLLAAGGRTAVERLLRRNRALVARIRRLSDTDRRLVAVVLQDQYAGDAKRAEARAILRYSRTGLFEDLGRLSYENVTAILQPRPHDPGDASRPGGREDGLPPPRPDRLLGDEVALDLLLNHAGRDLGEAARRYGAAVQPGSDEDVAAEVEVGERPIVRRLRNGQSALEIPLARLATADVWGGVVNAPGAVDFVAAVQAMDADDAQVLPFRPADHDQVGEMLERVVERGIADVSALRNWEEYEAARTALLPHVHCLADHPLMALAEAAELRERAGRLITAHANFLEAVRSVAAAMRQRSSFEPAKRLLARVLCLDLIFVRSAQDAVAIAAPSHPFHLWRWLAFEELVRDHSEDFRELGVDVLRQLVLDPPPTGPNILVSPHVTELGLEQEAIYVEIGSFGALPVFGDPQSRVTGRFRTDVLTTIANNLIRLAGHARFGLRVALIDPPSVADAVEALLQLPARAGGPVPIHVEIFRTKTGPTASEEEHVQMEGLQGTLEEAGGSVRIHREEMTLAEIAALLAVEAAHLVVVFEPGRGRIYPVGVDAPPALSPLVIPRVYQYDAFDDRFTVVVAADARTFGPYYDVFCEAMSLPQSHFFGQHSGSSDWQADLETLAAQALWIVLVDKSLEPTFHLGHATRLDWRSAGGRDVVTFTMYPGTIEDFVAQVVELAGLIPNDRTVARTSAAMRTLGGDTMLMPVGGSSGVPVDPRVAKGLVGTLAAARAISLAQAGALVVSLDDRHSRRWILGAQADDARRSDLLSVRQVEDGVVLTAVEVKTHDDADGTIALVNGRATGRAIQQIDSTIRVLRRIFAGVGATALDKARREILQDQLYRALASRPMERGDRERSVQVLKELFRSGPVRIEGALCKVRIASGAPSALPREPRHSYLTPEGNTLTVSEIVEGEEPGPVAPPLRPTGGAGPDEADREHSPPDPGLGAPADLWTSSENSNDGPVTPDGTVPERATRADIAERVRVLLGHRIDGREVHWDPADPEKPLMNFGVLVTGDPGSGKTQTLRALIDGVVRSGLPVCIFDFKNDYADPAFATPLGLSVYDVNRDGLPFNPLGLLPDEHGEAQPIRQVHEIGSILRRIFGLGDQQEARLRRAIVAAFEARGIAPRERRRVADQPPAPSFDEVVSVLEADDSNEALLNRLAPLFDLNLFPSADAAPTRLEQLLEAQIVLDLHRLPDDRIKGAMAEFIIVRLHGFLIRGAQPRALRRLLVFDEAWRVKESKRLEELAREGRAFGVGIAVGTQYPRDVPEALSGSLETQIFLYNREAEHQRAIVRSLAGATSGPVANQLLAKVSVLEKHQGFIKNQQYSPYVLANLLPHYKRS